MNGTASARLTHFSLPLIPCLPLAQPIDREKSWERHCERQEPSFDERFEVDRHDPGGRGFRAQLRVHGERAAKCLSYEIPRHQNKNLRFHDVRIRLVPLPHPSLYLWLIQTNHTRRSWF